MDWAGPNFVVLIIAVSTVGWLVNNWIRARHGYALEDEFFGKTEPAAKAEADSLRQENAELARRLKALEERTATLEAIVTDSGFDTSRQIEALRDKPRTALENAAH
ncbi:hypothetical protein [Novosphingobium beihaiensis]|uniref:Phage shock protein B n=1 Tax=Novosphingobium beihaiensis TaxID=2930389 RepID=A0ABT0BVN7_9SPHN|nr:hypothetical protein [Novosphingobium beihaiensis]MCJ2188943.1 hypothetical protein [Novosphingobium beihaiensis]